MLSWQRAAAAGVSVLTLVAAPGALGATGDFAISSGHSSRLSAGSDSVFGLQIGLDAAGGSVHAAWADNSPELPGNPDPPNYDIAAASIADTTLS